MRTLVPSSQPPPPASPTLGSSHSPRANHQPHPDPIHPRSPAPELFSRPRPLPPCFAQAQRRGAPPLPERLLSPEHASCSSLTESTPPPLPCVKVACARERLRPQPRPRPRPPHLIGLAGPRRLCDRGRRSRHHQELTTDRSRWSRAAVVLLDPASLPNPAPSTSQAAARIWPFPCRPCRQVRRPQRRSRLVPLLHRSSSPQDPSSRSAAALLPCSAAAAASPTPPLLCFLSSRGGRCLCLESFERTPRPLTAP